MLYKRSNSKFYWCRFTAPDGQRVQQSTQTVDKKLAQEFEDRLKSESWRVYKLGDKLRYSWKEASSRAMVPGVFAQGDNIHRQATPELCG